MEQEQKAKPLLRGPELAAQLNCGRSTVYRLAQAGQIPCIRIGKAGVRFDLDEVLASLRSARRGRSAA